MAHNANLVSDEYDRLHPDKPPADRTRDIHERCRIARDLFGSLPPDTQESLALQAQEDYDKQQQQFKQLQDSLLNVAPPTLGSQIR